MVAIIHSACDGSSTFPRKYPNDHLDNSHSQKLSTRPADKAVTSSWNCINFDITDPENHHPTETKNEFSPEGNAYRPSQLMSVFQNELSNHKNVLQQKASQQQRKQNDPKSIQFTSFDDDHDKLYQTRNGCSNEAYEDLPLDLSDLNMNEVSLIDTSLEESFGFERDGDFERLYSEIHSPTREGERNQHRQVSTCSEEYESSVGLNPYGAGSSSRGENVCSPKHNHVTTRQQGGSRIATPESIFRTRNNKQSSTTQIPRSITPRRERNDNVKLLSPIEVMERRRSSKPSVGNPNINTVSPISDTTGSLSAAESKQSRSRQSRSVSRSRNRNRSRSQGTRCRRSRSRSTSKVPGFRQRLSLNDKDDGYHASLFRGAALIRSQLLRSMASADQAMDEAEREFMEEMIERGRYHGTNVSRANSGTSAEDPNTWNAGVLDLDDDDEIDFDYSHVPFNGGKKSGVRFSAQTDEHPKCSSGLGTESHRLDELARFLSEATRAKGVDVTSKDVAFASNTSLTLHTKKSPSCEEEFVGDSSVGDVATEYSEHGMSRRSNVMQKNSKHGDTAREEFSGPLRKVPLYPGDPINGQNSVLSPISTSDISNHSAISKHAKQSNSHTHYAQKYFQDTSPKSSTDFPVPDISLSASLSSAESAGQYPQRQQDGNDEALAHARLAGPFWRSLVGNHVRFPSSWDNILPPTTPELHRDNRKWSKWYYVARQRVRGDRILNSSENGVRSRRSGGRIILRLVVREIHTNEVCREIAIGCLHPNAKGIREGEPLPALEDARDIWMAVRWVMKAHEKEPSLDFRIEKNDYEGVLDKFLLKDKKLDYKNMGSPLGKRKAVNNENVRAVFGDQPPIKTLDFHEDELVHALKSNLDKTKVVSPAMSLVRLFLSSK